MRITSVQLEQGPPLRLTCYTKATPIVIRIVLGVIASLAFLAPLIALITMLASEDGFRAGILVSFIIMWSIGMYLTRMILWNSYGKEIIEFSDNVIHYHCDYKYFQSNQRKIGAHELEVEMVPVSESEQTSKLLFTNGQEKLEMVLAIPEMDLFPVKERLNKLLRK